MELFTSNAGPDKVRAASISCFRRATKAKVPEGYFVARSRTFGVWLMGRGFKVNGDLKPGVESIKKNLRIYPLAQVKGPPETKFISASGVELNTVHANDFSYFEELNQIVQEEPSEALDPERLGLFASIGIEKGKPFAPDARMEKILTEAAAVGTATARIILFRTRSKEAPFYPGSAWITTFVGGSYEFLSKPGVRNLDARTLFFYYSTGITPAMALKMVGIGSQYAAAFVDSEGKPLDGGKTYKIHLPPNIPAKDFWPSSCMTIELARCCRPISSYRGHSSVCKKLYAKRQSQEAVGSEVDAACDFGVLRRGANDNLRLG